MPPYTSLSSQWENGWSCDVFANLENTSQIKEIIILENLVMVLFRKRKSSEKRLFFFLLGHKYFQ